MNRFLICIPLALLGCATTGPAPQSPPPEQLDRAWPTDALRACYRDYLATYGGELEGERLSSERGPTVAGEMPWRGDVLFTVRLSPGGEPDVASSESPDPALVACWSGALREPSVWPETEQNVVVERPMTFGW